MGTRELFGAPSLKRENYRGVIIPTGVGVLMILSLLVGEMGMTILVRAGVLREGGNIWWHLGFLVLVVGVGLVGLLDDVVGVGPESGIRGHLGALFRGEITSGLLKAIAGFALALVAVSVFSNQLWQLFLNAVLVALMVNFLNLLDRRPGRSIKFFWLVYIAVVLVNRGLEAPFLGQSGSILASSILLFIGDMRERFMLGDAGSNVLGATVGYGLAIGLGTWTKLALVGVVLALTLLSEKYSFSRAVERSNILKVLDNLGGIRRRRAERS